MKTAIGILLILYAAWSSFINLIPLLGHAKLKSAFRDAGLENNPTILESMTPQFHYHMGMLLTALGAGAVGTFYISRDDLTFLNMAGALVAYFGYGSIIQCFFGKYRTAAKVSSHGGDFTEFQRTQRFLLLFGLSLLAIGIYLAL